MSKGENKNRQESFVGLDGELSETEEASQFEIGSDSEKHMTDIRKYVEGKTQEELIETQRNSVVGGDVYKAVTFEIQRIQQDTNNIQIANLIEEIKKLKDITDSNAKDSVQNAESSNRLARIAIWIAVITLIVQVIFSTHQKSDCIWSSVSSSDPVTHYSGCYRQFDLGLLGTYTFSLPDR